MGPGPHPGLPSIPSRLWARAITPLQQADGPCTRMAGFPQPDWVCPSFSTYQLCDLGGVPPSLCASMSSSIMSCFQVEALFHHVAPKFQKGMGSPGIRPHRLFEISTSTWRGIPALQRQKLRVRESACLVQGHQAPCLLTLSACIGFIANSEF